MFYGTTRQGPGPSDTVFKLNKDGSGYAVLHDFSNLPGDGRSPPGGLIEGADGALYGATSYGGTSDAGTVFKLNKNGSGYTILYEFAGPDGQSPFGRVVQGTDGALYGTTWSGGANNLGVVFRLKADGGEYQVLRSFGQFAGDACSPSAELIESSDGALYGTTWAGGSNGVGTVFKISKDGNDCAILYEFSASGSDGQNPGAGLIEDSNGALYGTTVFGGTNGAGTAFTLNKDGTGYQVLHHFGNSGADGQNPWNRLVEGKDGFLYGTTMWTGSRRDAWSGTVIKLSKDGSSYLRLTSSDSNTNCVQPAGLLQGSDGSLYVLAAGGGISGEGNVFRLSTDGSACQLLRSFNWTGGDGRFPQAAAVEGTDGALYGTTVWGGAVDMGTVFRVNKDGTDQRVLHSFGAGGDDGQNPYCRILEGEDGALYGTTVWGGSNNLGTVFKLKKDGSSYTVIHRFGTLAGDGVHSWAGLVQDASGALYGTTQEGGTEGLGAIFKLSTDGSQYSLLYSFSTNSFDGSSPITPLMEGSDGVLYGTTCYGGSNNVGTVFKLNLDGNGYRILHHFTGGSDGNWPAGLVEAADGTLYGTTAYGGTNGTGTVFKMNKDGTGYTTIYSFDGPYSEPNPILIEGTDQRLYGTTFSGGTNSVGTAFSLNKDGTGYRVLYTFGSSTLDGKYPKGLIQASDGAFYGTTDIGGLGVGGGEAGFGTVFRFWPPETPDVTAITCNGPAMTITFSGEAGWDYQVLRSIDMINWTVVDTITMPQAGIYTSVDPYPPMPGAFYRAAWTR